MDQPPAQYRMVFETELFEGKFTSQVFPWHYHTTYTVILVESGAVHYHFHEDHAPDRPRARQTITVGAGQLFIVNPYEAHYNETADPSGWQYRVFFLPAMLFHTDPEASLISSLAKDSYLSGTGASLSDITKQPASPIPRFNRTALRDTALFDDLVRLHKALKPALSRAAYLRLIHTVTEPLIRHYPSTLSATPPAGQPIKGSISAPIGRPFPGPIDGFLSGPDNFPGWLLPALQYVEEHLGDRLTVQRLADVCYLSKYHFQRRFKTATGLTVNAYIQQRRMETGRQLLRADKKVTEAALTTGYFDPSHFLHQFKKMWGLTPGRFSE